MLTFGIWTSQLQTSIRKVQNERLGFFSCGLAISFRDISRPNHLANRGLGSSNDAFKATIILNLKLITIKF